MPAPKVTSRVVSNARQAPTTADTRHNEPGRDGTFAVKAPRGLLGALPGT
ncbi:hypothetical protein GCM10027184_68860 [Saccharothrix stipae]